MAKASLLQDKERVATDQEARAALKQFFGSLSPSEVRRMYQLFLELQASGAVTLASSANGR